MVRLGMSFKIIPVKGRCCVMRNTIECQHVGHQTTLDDTTRDSLYFFIDKAFVVTIKCNDIPSPLA